MQTLPLFISHMIGPTHLSYIMMPNLENLPCDCDGVPQKPVFAITKPSLHAFDVGVTPVMNLGLLPSSQRLCILL